ncbi:MAG TPA: hypothetical protein VMD25_06655 [Acidobacteriaceae bacterium]|nr:hypothetical protein [Acidobacteriaceae bacterium]
MAGELKLNDDPIILVRLTKGLADRHRLPLADVLSIMDELRQMISEAGRRIQRERGVPVPTGDFGLEVIAKDDGKVFRAGSVELPIAMTANIQIGLLAAEQVVRTFSILESERGVPEPDTTLDQTILRRISRVARVQRRDRMELEVRIDRPGSEQPVSATFGSAGMETLRALQVPTFQVEGVSLYGKLVQLVDYDPFDEQQKGFWGELILSDMERWRVQFKSSDVDKATCLFRKQVHITGRAVHYRVTTPKVVVESIEPDTERDYEAAFDELFGSYKDVFKADLETLIKQAREED